MVPDRLCGYLAGKPKALPFGEGAGAKRRRERCAGSTFSPQALKNETLYRTSSVTASPCHLPQRGRLSLRKSKFTDTNSPELSFRCVKKGSTGKGIAFSGGLAGARHKACDCLGAAGELEGERPAFPLDFQSHKTDFTAQLPWGRSNLTAQEISVRWGKREGGNGLRFPSHFWPERKFRPGSSRGNALRSPLIFNHIKPIILPR